MALFAAFRPGWRMSGGEPGRHRRLLRTRPRDPTGPASQAATPSTKDQKPSHDKQIQPVPKTPVEKRRLRHPNLATRTRRRWIPKDGRLGQWEVRARTTGGAWRSRERGRWRPNGEGSAGPARRPERKNRYNCYSPHFVVSVGLSRLVPYLRLTSSRSRKYFPGWSEGAAFSPAESISGRYLIIRWTLNPLQNRRPYVALRRKTALLIP